MLWMTLSLFVLSLRRADTAGPTYWSVSLPRTRCPHPTPRQGPSAELTARPS